MNNLYKNIVGDSD
jgi:spastin